MISVAGCTFVENSCGISGSPSDTGVPSSINTGTGTSATGSTTGSGMKVRSDIWFTGTLDVSISNRLLSISDGTSLSFSL